MLKRNLSIRSLRTTLPFISEHPSLTTQPYKHFTNNPVEADPSRTHLARMSLSKIYRHNAEDCAFLAEFVGDGEVKRALKRMEEAWRTLAQEQEQLDHKKWSTKKPPL